MAIEITGSASAVSARGASGEAAHLSVRYVTDRHEWDALLAACRVPHLPQAFAYGQAKASSGWEPHRALLSRHGEPLALVTVLELRRFGIRLLNRVNRGPLFLIAAPTDDDVLAAYRTIRNHWGRWWTAPLLIAPALDQGEHIDQLLRQAGYIRRTKQSWLSGRIDLSADEAAIWAGFNSTFRNRVRSAEKAGAELEITDGPAAYDWMIARHIENMKEKGFSAFTADMLRTLRASAPENVLVFRLLQGGSPVAGMSVVRFGQFAEYHVGWFGPEGRKLNAGNFLMWNIVRELKRRGVVGFDVGGMKHGDGYTRFKRTMNPVEYELAGEWMSF